MFEYDIFNHPWKQSKSNYVETMPTRISQAQRNGADLNLISFFRCFGDDIHETSVINSGKVYRKPNP